MTENRCDCKPQNIELVRKTRDSMPDYRKISDLSDFFKVMGDSTRLQLLIALQTGEFCVSDLSYLLNNYQQKKTEIDKAKKDLMNFYHFNKAVNNYLDYLDECDTDCELFIYNKWR